MTDAIFFKPIQERGWSSINLRLFDNYNTTKVRVYSTWSEMGSNGYISIISRTMFGIVYSTEPLIEEVIEALMNVICLTHHYSMALNG